MTIHLPYLENPNTPFPAVETALSDPDGLLAFGGDLSPIRLLSAYQNGIFPWYSHDDPILWWSPSKRAILKPSEFTPSKSLKKCLRQSYYQVSLNKATKEVIELCASTRSAEETWITTEMQQAYIDLIKLGHCHSIEVWDGEQLVGGLYGLLIGKVFCGESMFSLQTNTSKIAFWHLCYYFDSIGGKLIDCQLENAHLISLGVNIFERSVFIQTLQQLTTKTIERDLLSPRTLHAPTAAKE
ncbi:leucyl/phenylalanyl-tRNA--protein transferase [Vibrio sp. S11_S32]|uniref:leucyl/phenylalanyl-tRNA--protein transferase n=1 Tax=Vibrio sp. S11_S32 TaxID=2720225 RepID=UPI00168068D1|nr:leucyl/phenylalanyl-tRNA--protein transferase [Vibrio sp. S11_S32]MBD1576735.1 leucyl/phenylalanyl-tRNA--protein transferase [Vibrio sp. S11_S32]